MEWAHGVGRRRPRAAVGLRRRRPGAVHQLLRRRPEPGAAPLSATGRQARSARCCSTASPGFRSRWLTRPGAGHRRRATEASRPARCHAAGRPDLPGAALHRAVPARGARGLLVAAILAAAMSSLDSALNSLSAATLRDFVEPRLGPAPASRRLRRRGWSRWPGAWPSSPSPVWRRPDHQRRRGHQPHRRAVLWPAAGRLRLRHPRPPRARAGGAGRRGRRAGAQSVARLCHGRHVVLDVVEPERPGGGGRGDDCWAAGMMAPPTPDQLVGTTLDAACPAARVRSPRGAGWPCCWPGPRCGAGGGAGRALACVEARG